MHPFESHLQAQLHAHDWQSVTSAVAVSGGADSMALLSALTQCKASTDGRLIVLHFNHRLRGQAGDEDALFVAAAARQRGLDCVLGQAEENAIASEGASLEAAARDVRYQFFVEACNAQGARYLFLAHTADDQAETVLHRILRGTGIDGLAGIPPVRPLSALTTIVRPLLSITREEVLAYLTAMGQPFRDDATNLDLQFTRNRLRHDLLPKLRRDYNPHIRSALLRLGDLAAEASECLEALAAGLYQQTVHCDPGVVVIDTMPLRCQPPYLVRVLLAQAWKAQGWPLQAMTYEKWQQLAGLSLGQADGTLNLPGDVRAKKQGKQLKLTRPAKD